MTLDPYYDRAEVSNSDLHSLELMFSTSDYKRDATEAYRFGTLLDAICTEQERVNYFKCTVDDVKYTKAEFRLAEKMKKSFFQDKFCSLIAQRAQCQKVTVVKGFKMQYMGVDFSLDMRCKWDFFVGKDEINGDLKSTTATTQQQFEAAVKYFKYHRQRALYMDLEGTNRDVLIGVSKKNMKVFKVPIERGDKLYTEGKEDYLKWAFKWWCLFHDFEAAA